MRIRQHMEIILASKSPRRRELMERMGLSFSVVESGADENISKDLPPEEYVKELSYRKAAYVAREHRCACVVGSDTIVVYDGKILGKPKTRDEAFSMLRMLSGKTHTVYTGIAVVCGDKTLVDCDATRVTFSELSDDEINGYIDTGDPMDKAGAYGIQGRFCSYIERVEGSFFTVMGLPVHLLYKMLKEIEKE